MKSKSKEKIRSRVGLVEFRLNNIDRILNDIFKQLDSSSNNELKGQAIEYLKWAHKKYEIINQEKKYNNSEILKKISQLENMLHKKRKINKTAPTLITNTAFKCSDTMKIDQAYYHFLKHGPLFFHKIVDPFRLWLDKFNLREILTKNQPNILSYALIAVLSRFTLPHNSICYKQIYGKSLKGIKATLPQSYSNPSYNCVVALGLLSYISLSHSNYDLTKRYFLDAVRMAQCLGYDISDTLFDKINIMDLRYNELLRGRSIWKTLHFTYLVLSSCIPNIPFIKFQTKEPLCIPDGPNRSTDVDEIGYKAIDELPYLFVKDYTEVTIKIASHIQKVKENYERRNDYSDIPINALLLPQNEFIICFTTLLNLIQDQKLIRDECDYTQKELDEKTNDYEFNFKRYLKVLIQHVIVQLYYPFATVYPRPVRFTKSKLKLLFYYSNQVITYCLNRGLDRKLDHSSFSENSQFDSKYQLQSNVCTPFYYQITYSFFTLVNLIHQSNNLSKADVTMVDEAKAKCVLLVKELYSVSKANNKRYAKDSTNALNQIKRCIHRFELPVDLIQEIAMYLN